MDKIDYAEVIENDFERDFYKNIHNKIKKYLMERYFTTFWDIVREVGGSDRRVLRLLHQMLLAKEIKLNENYISLYKGTNKIKSLTKDVKCFECKGKTISIEGKFSKIKKTMEEILTKRPIPTFLFDQRPVTIETTVYRAAYLAYRGDLTNKRIAIIGDDDLTSIALGLTKQAKEIIVFDIDDRLINFINNLAKEEKLNIAAYKYDLTKRIPTEFSEHFDVFLTDPTPNAEAFSLFVSIGLNLLRKGRSFTGYVSYFPSHQDIDLSFQNMFTNKKVIITDIIPKFTEYDFIKETYTKEDLELLEKFDSGGKRLSFNENFTRFETTEETVKEVDILTKESKKSILGKATKKILDNFERDPAFIHGEKEFVTSVAKLIKEENANE